MLAGLIFFSAYQKQHWDTDIFWALKSGESIVSNLKVPHADPFSYTFLGREWVDFTWGFQVIAHLVFSRLGGWAGLFALQLVATGAALSFVFLAAREHLPGRPWVSASLALLVYASSHTRFFIRPHLAEYFFIPLYILILALYEKRDKVWLLYLFPLLQIIWINIHSSAVLGAFILGAYAAGQALDEFRLSGFKLRVTFSRKVTWLVAISVVTPLASMVNPYGVRLVIFPFIHQAGENADALRHIGEWTHTPLREVFFFFYPFPLDHFAFVAVFFGVFALLFLNRRAMKCRDLIMAAALGYMATRHARWMPLFAYVGAPIMAANIAEMPAPLERFGRKLPPAAVAMAVVMLIEFSGARHRSELGLGIKSGAYPEGTVGFMKAEGIKGNIFNEYVYGGYLIYYYPEMKVFIDGRTPTVYSPYFFWTARLEHDAPRWKRLVEEHGIDVALVRNVGASCTRLFEDKGWSAVSFDDVSALFLKRGGKGDAVISRWGLKELNPCSSESSRYKPPHDKKRLQGIIGELRRVVSQEALTGVRLGRTHRINGIVYSELASVHEEAPSPGGDDKGKAAAYLEEAVKEFQEAVSLNDDASNNYSLGAALGRLKRYVPAMAAFKRAIMLDENHRDAYMGLGLSYYDSGGYKDAIKSLKRYVYAADDEAEHAAYKALGMAYFKTSDFGNAVIYLKRAAFTIDIAKEQGNIYYYLGNSFYEMGEYEEGSMYYQQAIEKDGDYRKVLENLAIRHRAVGRAEDAERIDHLVSKGRAR